MKNFSNQNKNNNLVKYRQLITSCVHHHSRRVAFHSVLRRSRYHDVDEINLVCTQCNWSILTFQTDTSNAHATYILVGLMFGRAIYTSANYLLYFIDILMTIQMHATLFWYGLVKNCPYTLIYKRLNHCRPLISSHPKKAKMFLTNKFD